MKKKTLSTETQVKSDSLHGNRKYPAHSKGNDIMDRDDDEYDEEEPLPEEIAFPAAALDDEEDEIDEAVPPTLFLNDHR